MGVDRRAVSPAVAVLILITAAVAAGVLVYNFTVSYAGVATKTTSLQVTSVSLVKTSTQGLFAIQVKNTGTTQVTGVQVRLYGESGYAPLWSLGTIDPGQTKGDVWGVDQSKFVVGRMYAVYVYVPGQQGAIALTVLCEGG